MILYIQTTEQNADYLRLTHESQSDTAQKSKAGTEALSVDLKAPPAEPSSSRSPLMVDLEASNQPLQSIHSTNALDINIPSTAQIAMDSGRTTMETDTSDITSDPRLENFLDAIGKNPKREVETMVRRQEETMIDCVVCEGQQPEGSPTIRCSRCYLWSHIYCVRQQFGLDDKTMLNVKIPWLCPGRCDRRTPLWNDNL